MAAPDINARNLKRLRKSRRLRQGDVAQLLDVSRSSVSKVETGKRELTGAERKLLEWYFFGRVPMSLHQPWESAVTFSFR